MRPTVGRNVHYLWPGQSAPWAAIITEVHPGYKDGDVIGLFIMPPGRNGYPDRASNTQGNVVPAGASPRWCWPPQIRAEG